MKNQRGITLTSLIVYVIVLLIALVMFSVMRSNIENNIQDISKESNLESEFNKFNIYFAKDVKTEGNKVKLDGENKIEFSSGNSYEFEEEGKKIVLTTSGKTLTILERVNSCTFAIDLATGKKVITVSILFDGLSSPITKEYVLLEEGEIGYQNEEEYISIVEVDEPEYTEIEYIQSTGTQYIDTGINPSSNIGIYIRFMETVNQESGGLFGSFGNGRAYYFGFSQWNSALETFYGNQSNNISRPTISLNTEYELFFNYLNDKSIICNDNVSNNIGTITSSNYSIWIFAINKGSTAYDYYKSLNTRIYECKITDGSNIVRDYIPVLDKNNVACLYDKIEGRYYYNQGTGDFVAGPEI